MTCGRVQNQLDTLGLIVLTGTLEEINSSDASWQVPPGKVPIHCKGKCRQSCSCAKTYRRCFAQLQFACMPCVGLLPHCFMLQAVSHHAMDIGPWRGGIQRVSQHCSRCAKAAGSWAQEFQAYESLQRMLELVCWRSAECMLYSAQIMHATLASHLFSQHTGQSKPTAGLVCCLGVEQRLHPSQSVDPA